MLIIPATLEVEIEKIEARPGKKSDPILTPIISATWEA
jgi:hypothetical protein